MGRVVEIPKGIYTIWEQQQVYIAQLELLMVWVAIIECGQHLKHKRGVWFIDNVAALMALVRGRSNQPSLDALALLIHAALFTLRAWVYFEWVESKANWSDGISRDGFHDEWSQRQLFRVQACTVPYPILTLPLGAVLRVYEYLFGGAA